MKITFETAESHAEETILYVQPDDLQLAQQEMDFVQQRSDLLKFLAFAEQATRAVSPSDRVAAVAWGPA